MIALHVPASFAKDKNRLSRALNRVGKTADVKKRWDFIDQASGASYGRAASEDPLQILKVKLVEGEISQTEYEKLRQTVTS